MKIETSILHSILKYNGKELTKGYASNPLYKMFYVDENGAITFNTGACVNKFKLEKPVKMLLNSKLVKLFKLFTEDNVNFTLGYDATESNLLQTKASFADDFIQLTAILGCDDTMLRSVPVSSIRGSVEIPYPYSVVLGRNQLIQAIDRLMILDNGIRGTMTSANFCFGENSLLITDSSGENTEVINYVNSCENLKVPYRMSLQLSDFKIVVQSREEAYLTISFGERNAVVISHTNLFNVIPELLMTADS